MDKLRRFSSTVQSTVETLISRGRAGHAKLVHQVTAKRIPPAPIAESPKAQGSTVTYIYTLEDIREERRRMDEVINSPDFDPNDESAIYYCEDPEKAAQWSELWWESDGTAAELFTPGFAELIEELDNHNKDLEKLSSTEH